MHFLFQKKGASGTTDEYFVLLSLHACLSLHVTHKTPHGGGGRWREFVLFFKSGGHLDHGPLLGTS